MINILKKNILFLLLLAGLVFVYITRYHYLPTPIVSKPDSQIAFSTQDVMLEQTWQPAVKIISGVSIPYYVEDAFSCDVELKIYTDDYSQIIVDSVIEGYAFPEEELGIVDFSFDKTKMILGERYRIQISLLNVSEEGLLQIASGSNYGGCMIAKQELNEAAAFTVTFAKYSKLFWLVSVIFPLFTFSLCAMTLTKKKWEEVVALSLFCEGIFLFISGMFEQLVLGINLIYVLAIISLLIAIYLFNKKDINIKDLFSPGLFIYFALFLIIVISSNGDWLGRRDDLRHWGPTVRDMFYYDSFGKHRDTTLILPRYLPFAAIIEYVFVYMNGIFGEDLLLIANQTMILSTLIIVCKPLQKKTCLERIIPIMVALICVPVIFFSEISGSILVDPLQAAIMAYVLICYYSDEMTWFNRIRILVGLIALTLIKDIGLVFAGMIALIMFGDAVILQIQKKKLRIKELCYPIACVIIVLAMYVSWQFYLTIPVENVNKPKQQSEEGTVEENTTTASTAISASGISISGIFKVLSGEGEEYQYQVTRNLIIELLDGETYSLAMMSFSFADLLLLISFIIVSFGYYGFWDIEKTRMYVFSGLLILSGLCLCAFLQLIYWFTFSSQEALVLGSLGRYLAPYLCALWIVVMYLLCSKEQDKVVGENVAKYIIYVLAFVLTISMPWEGLVIESKDAEENATEEMVYGYDEIAEILRSVSKRGEKVQFICSESDGYSEYIFRNAVCPLISTHANWRIVASDEIFDEQYDMYKEKYGEEYKADVITEEELQTKLEECHYLVVFHADNGFIKSYSDLFGVTAIEDGSVYKVTEADGFSLELIGKASIKKWR